MRSILLTLPCLSFPATPSSLPLLGSTKLKCMSTLFSLAPSILTMDQEIPPADDSPPSEATERVVGDSSSSNVPVEDADDSSAFLTGVNLERERRESQGDDDQQEAPAIENMTSVLASIPVAGPRGRSSLARRYSMLASTGPL